MVFGIEESYVPYIPLKTHVGLCFCAVIDTYSLLPPFG